MNHSHTRGVQKRAHKNTVTVWQYERGVMNITERYAICGYTRISVDLEETLDFSSGPQRLHVRTA